MSIRCHFLRLTKVLHNNSHKFNNRHFSTVAQEMKNWLTKFEEEKVFEPEASIKHLMARVLETQSLDDVELNQNLNLTAEQKNKLESLCHARLSRMPIQYLVGDWEFRQLTLQMIPPVFIPRPETEELVGFVLNDLEIQPTEQLEILEIGCGSGAISLSLLSEIPTARCIALDQNKLACGLTKMNAESLGLADRLEVVECKVENGNLPVVEPDKKFDLIISNPPYVPTKELRQMQDEIKLYEDLRALDGGIDGLKVILHILEVANNYLKVPNGALWLEVHPSHPEMIKEKLNSSPQLGLKVESVLKDFCSKDRFIKIVKV